MTAEHHPHICIANRPGSGLTSEENLVAISTLIPNEDRLPTVVSRTLLVRGVDFTEGAPAAGEITFGIPWDVNVPLDGAFIQAGEVTLTLDSNGEARIRVPTSHPSTDPESWYIYVKKSWAPHPYAIRVPVGTSTINLVDIVPLQEIPSGAAPGFFLTGAGVELEVGGTPSATVTTSGGIANFKFTLPSGNWDRGLLTTASNIDTLIPGAYGVPSGAVATALALPVIRIGTLEVNGFGAGRTQRFTTNANGPTQPMEIWERASHGTGAFPSPEWNRIFPIMRTPNRTAAQPLVFSRGIDTDTRPLVQVRVPVKFGADVEKIRAVFRNYDYRADTPYTGVLNFAGVAFGKHQMNADGSMTGLFSETPTVLATAFSSPADAATFHTGARTTVNAKAGVEYLLSFSYEAASAGQVNVASLGACFTSLIKNAWNTVGTTTATRQNLVPLSIFLEVEVAAGTPVYAYWGDSLTSGLNASAPARDSWAFRHALREGAIAQVYAYPGGSLNEWQDPMKAAGRAWEHLDKPDRLYAAMGFNDIEAARPLSGMQSLFNTAATNLMARTTKNLYLATILPNGSTTANNTVRTAYNRWLEELPLNAQMVADFHSAIVNPATGLTDARWSANPTSGDSHLNTAGYARIASLA